MFAYCLSDPVNRTDLVGDSSVWYWLIVDHDMGFVHRAVQAHIQSNNPSILTETVLENGRRPDIVLSPAGLVWEVKHESVIPELRKQQALEQARGYIGKKVKKSGLIISGLGGADVFTGNFTMSVMDTMYDVYYYTPQAGVVLYRVTELSGEKAGSTVPFAAKEKNSFRIGFQALPTPVTYSAASGGPILGGLFAGLVSCER